MRAFASRTKACSPGDNDGRHVTHPLEIYLRDCDQIRQTGANAPETSFYPALSNLLNEAGRHLKPRVRCVMNLANRGAGLPDGGLFAEPQFRRRADSEPEPGQAPERGVIEVKAHGTAIGKLIAGEQVARYWAKYRLVLVTDLREFVLLGEDNGAAAIRERYSLAPTAAAFWDLARHPRKAADEQGLRFLEFVQRVLLHAAPLLDPDAPVQGVTAGAIRPDLRGIGVITREGGGALDPGKGGLALNAGWGHAGRDLTIDEAEHVTNMARRISAIVLLADELDENYRACRDDAHAWRNA